jgi:hypothetical protein
LEHHQDINDRTVRVVRADPAEASHLDDPASGHVWAPLSPPDDLLQESGLADALLTLDDEHSALALSDLVQERL